MRKLVFEFNDLESLRILEKMEAIDTYIPKINGNKVIAFVLTNMSDEDILKHNGIKSVREQRTFTLNI